MLYYLLHIKKTFIVCLVFQQTYLQAHWHSGSTVYFVWLVGLLSFWFVQLTFSFTYIPLGPYHF